MFWSSPSADLEIIKWLLFFAVIMSVGVYAFSRKVLLSVAALSILGNIIFYLNSGSELFDIYNIKWVVFFTLDFWPWINLALVILLTINFIKNKYAKTKNK